jgi:hypothetical protein
MLIHPWTDATIIIDPLHKQVVIKQFIAFDVLPLKIFVLPGADGSHLQS